VNIELSDITRKFGRNTAVDGVSLEAGPGVLGLLGPNGAGKTSLLRMLATVLPPSAGELRLLERDPARPAPRREIRRRLGYLPQNLGYYPSFTVIEFVEPTAGNPAQAIEVRLQRAKIPRREIKRQQIAEAPIDCVKIVLRAIGCEIVRAGIAGVLRREPVAGGKRVHG